MTLIALESFDAIATADLPMKGWVVTGTGVMVSTTARTGANGLRLGTAITDHIKKGVPTSDEHATFILGFAVNTPLTNDTPIASIGSDGGSTTHVTLFVTSTGAIRVHRGSHTGTTLGSTAAAVITPNAWSYVECMVTLSDTVGAVTVRVNGVTELSLTNVDTKNAGTKTVFDWILLGRAPSAAAVVANFDDVYLCNAAGTINNTFLGDTRVRCLMPNGNGNSSQLVGSDGNSSDNYLLVDEVPPDTADYVSSATLNNKDTYAFTDIPDSSGVVHGVQISALASKNDAGARLLALVTRSSGTDYDSPDRGLSYGSNAYVNHVRNTDPATGAAWTRAAVNAAEFGAKVR